MQKYPNGGQRAGTGGPETERTYLELGVKGEGSGKVFWREEVVFEAGFGLGCVRKEAEGILDRR